MDVPAGSIERGDCIKRMNGLPDGCVDLAFADPPFNIGYEYDVYRDRLKRDQYLAWSRDWIAAVHRVLKDDGTFWLAIGDEYAAELKLASQEIGFHCRSWVVWYYTFGVNCDAKFTRSHAHLFHFVKDPGRFTFLAGEPENRIPSARQLVYADKRANPRGRLPDDTWIIRPAGIVGELTDMDDASALASLPPPADRDRTWTLRPQDLASCFQTTEDTWYFPRVAGTFKERAGFHGCQMPEQLLGRIIRACSREGELVLDPFSGSGTTVAVAKKLGRRFLAFDLSSDYVRLGRKRLAGIRRGDPLDGSAEPTMSAPKTGELQTEHARRKAAAAATGRSSVKRQLAITLAGVMEAFGAVYQGFSADRVVADPELNQGFVDACRALGLAGEARSWNMLLFRLRKAGKLVQFPTTERTKISWTDCDPYFFASEIALAMLLEDERAQSLDEILCDPTLSEEFEAVARRFAPGFSSLEYRWAALKLRKQARQARDRGTVIVPPARLGRSTPLDDFDPARLPQGPGVYLLSDKRSGRLYAGETLDLRGRLARKFDRDRRALWRELASGLEIQTRPIAQEPGQILAWESCLVGRYRPQLNYAELAPD